MRDEKENLKKTKESVLAELKSISLAKKDRLFLLTLIELFDWLSENENERFLARLDKLATAKEIQEDEEFKVRLLSLKTQLDSNKNLKTVSFPTFALYFQAEKVEVYIKKLPASWDNLIAEIDKINFSYILVNVYKAATKKDKLLATKLKKDDKKPWKESLYKILDEHIHTNVRITLFYPKQEL